MRTLSLMEPIRYCGVKHPRMDVHCTLRQGHMMHHKGILVNPNRSPDQQRSWINWTDDGKTWDGAMMAERIPGI